MHEQSDHEFRVPIWLWIVLLRRLRNRGCRVRESGAFLLGRRTSTVVHVKRFVLYDTLDPTALDTGIITFDSAGFPRLWQICSARQLEVVGDVHTHPGVAIQSCSDRSNPMIPRAGHIALIIPDYAQGAWWHIGDVGIFQYGGNGNWREGAAPRLQLTLI